MLAKVAKRLQPDSVDKVHEGDEARDKEKQMSNINAFIKFAKELGLSEQQVGISEYLSAWFTFTSERQMMTVVFSL